MQDERTKAFDEALERLQSGASIEECLAAYPQFANELAPLLQAAHRLRAEARADLPSSAESWLATSGSQEIAALARQMMRSRLVPKPDPEPTFVDHIAAFFNHGVPALVASIVTVLLVCMLSVSTLTTASAESLPGERLYEWKLLNERAQLVLTADPAKRGMLYASFVEHRAAELDQLLSNNNADSKQVDASLALLQTQFQQAITEAKRTDQRTEKVIQRRLDRQINRVEERVAQATNDTPPAATPSDPVRSAAVVVDSLQRDLVAQIPSKPETPSAPERRPTAVAGVAPAPQPVDQFSSDTRTAVAGNAPTPITAPPSGIVDIPAPSRIAGGVTAPTSRPSEPVAAQPAVSTPTVQQQRPVGATPTPFVPNAQPTLEPTGLSVDPPLGERSTAVVGAPPPVSSTVQPTSVPVAVAPSNTAQPTRTSTAVATAPEPPVRPQPTARPDVPVSTPITAPDPVRDPSATPTLPATATAVVEPTLTATATATTVVTVTTTVTPTIVVVPTATTTSTPTPTITATVVVQPTDVPLTPTSVPPTDTPPTQTFTETPEPSATPSPTNTTVLTPTSEATRTPVPVVIPVAATPTPDNGDTELFAVRPILECVTLNGDDSYVAYFGYLNENDLAIEIPVGNNNRFSPAPRDRGQPTRFEPGRSDYFPDAAFRVAFTGDAVVWRLGNRTATASQDSRACELP